MKKPLSIAIETSCRAGGLALGRGEDLVDVVQFNAESRHATHLVTQLHALLRSHNQQPRQIDHLYVSVGPGSFTGLRVGITVARTLPLAVPSIRCVAVPTALAVAENARALPWQHLAVIADARRGHVYASLFGRKEEQIVPEGEPLLATARQFLDCAPRPLLLIGEGLAYHDLTSRGDTVADEALHLPTAEAVWHVGRRLAGEGRFVAPHRLLPVYTRGPVPPDPT